MGNNIATLLDELSQFLEHERMLFGETLLWENGTVRPVSPETGTSIQQAHDVSKPSRNISNAIPDEPSLFGAQKPVRPPITTEEWGGASTLDQLNSMICECTKCALGATRTKFVFGTGNPHATLMFIGEAPGADEDAQGEPFVGRAGQLLTKIIEAIDFKRQDVYICNILKCRPPNNRKPTPEESDLCKPYLKKQIELVKPKVIVCLGLTAAENLLGTREPMGKLRGRVLSYEDVPVMITYHPAALLRNPAWKRPTWEDVQAVKKLHDELVAKSGA